MQVTFRDIAISMPQVTEGSHGGLADFRVGGRIFATLGDPDEHTGIVALRPQAQRSLCGAAPEIFTPVPGARGRAGATYINLLTVDSETLRSALAAAWQHRRPPAVPRVRVAGRRTTGRSQ